MDPTFQWRASGKMVQNHR